MEEEKRKNEPCENCVKLTTAITQLKAEMRQREREANDRELELRRLLDVFLVAEVNALRERLEGMTRDGG